MYHVKLVRFVSVKSLPYAKEHLTICDLRSDGEGAGIKVEGDNKWITIIQNAAKNKQETA
jgi:hypothetical protein